MKFLSVFKIYINSSIHVAFAVVSLCAFTAWNFKISLNFMLLVFVFSSTIIGYNYAKYSSFKKPKRHSQPANFRTIVSITLLAVFLLVLSCFFLRIESILFSAILCLLNILYATPIYKKPLREIPYLKVFIISFIWTAVSFGLPFIEAEKQLLFGKGLSFQIIERFCWVILLLIPFEIRDLTYDAPNLKTLATAFGSFKLKLFGVALSMALLVIRLVSFGIDSSLIYFVIYTSLTVVILYSKTTQNKYYASFWVEALPIFWMVSWVIIEKLSYYF